MPAKLNYSSLEDATRAVIPRELLESATRQAKETP